MAAPGSQEDIARAHEVLNRMLLDAEHAKSEQGRQREDRVATALERIADALEAQSAVQGMSAEFLKAAMHEPEAALAQPTPRSIEDYKESPTKLNHFLVLIHGEWMEALPDEDAQIREMIQRKRKR